jgi:hypothetical protein
MTTSSVRIGTSATLPPGTAAVEKTEANHQTTRAPRITARQSSMPASRTSVRFPENVDTGANEINDRQSGKAGQGAPKTAHVTPEVATFTQNATALQTRRRDAYPMTSSLISGIFVDRLFELTNVKVDPKNTWLDEFNGSTYGHRWQYHGDPVRSTSLSNLVREGFPADIDWDRIQMNGRAGTFSHDPQTGNRKQLSIDTSHLKRVVDEMRPLPEFQLARLGDFWGKSTQAHEGVHQQSLLMSAHAWQASHALHAGGKISDTALGMIRQVAGFPEGQPGNVHSYALDIGGYQAEDIAVLENTDGRSVMVIPGDAEMFREFPDKKSLRMGILKMASDPASRAGLASHFGLQDWRGSSYKAGIGSLLDMMGSQGAAANIPIFSDRAKITGDVFDWTAHRQSDARQAEAQTLLGKDGTFDSDAGHYLDRRGAQLFAAPMTTTAGGIDSAISPAKDPWLRELNEALASDNPAWWSPDSAMKEPTLTGLRALPAERQRDLAQRHFALEAVERQLSTLEPDLQISARRFMQDKLRDHFQFTRDPDQVMLVEYEQDYLKPDVFDPETGRPAIPNPNARRIRKSTPLSQLPINSMPYAAFLDQTGDAMQPTGRFAVRQANDIAKRWTPDMTSLLPVRALAALMRNKHEFDFESRVLKSTDDFYRQHGPVKTGLAQQKALLTAELMAAEGKLSQQDYELARSGFGVSPTAGSRNGIPRAQVSTHELDIGKRVSLDSLRIEDKNTGRTLLYLPGEETPIRPFGDRASAVNWLMKMHADPALTDRFVADHFSVTNARAGVSSLMHAPKRASSLNREKFLNSTADINNQPFAWLNERQHAQVKIDLTQEITSPGDMQTNWWLNALEKTPIPLVSAATKTVLAPTLEQRREGLQELGMEALVEVFMAGAAKAVVPAAKGLSEVWKNMRRLTNNVTDDAIKNVSSSLSKVSIDRWFKPPQRVNGQIGYPMGPINAPKLPEMPADNVLPVRRSSLDDLSVSQRVSHASNGIVNHGFAHTAGDTIPVPVRTSSLKETKQTQAPVHFEMQNMKNREGSSATSGYSDGSTGTQSITPAADPVLSEASTSRRSSITSSSSDSAYFEPDPTPTQLERAQKILKRNDQKQDPAPDWLKNPGGLADENVRSSAISLPEGVTTVDEMVALQQKEYADMVNRHTIDLANAYRRGDSPAVVTALIGHQTTAQITAQNIILSQRAQFSRTDPLTNLDLPDTSRLVPGRAWFLSARGKQAIERLTQSKATKEEELSTFLSRNMSNNNAVRTYRDGLQKRLDDEVKDAITGIENSKTRRIAIGTVAAGSSIGAAGLIAGFIPKGTSQVASSGNQASDDKAKDKMITT